MKLRCLPALALVALAACGGSSTSPSGDIQVAGTWSGSITRSNQTSPARITIAQSGAVVTGTWNASGPGGPDSGTMDGSVSGKAVSMVLRSSVPVNCPYNVTVTVSGKEMTGTYAAFQCSIVVSGSIALTRQ